MVRYSLGLDIGTTSIGWAVINEDKNRIEDVGVRIFERPENPKNGDSLAKPRRDARSARRRLRRRRQRLDYLKQFFINHNLLTPQEVQDLLTYDSAHTHKDPYELRAKALQEKIPNDELFVALYHIAKRRGYKSNRKAVEEKDKESGRVLQAIKENQHLLAQYNNSVAQTLLEDKKFEKHKRNKADDYTNSFIRADFEREILAILQTQNWSQNDIDELLTKPNKGLFYQRPFMTKELIQKMRGQCQLEKDQPRAPRASYTFEIFRLASDLANLTYNSKERLTKEQIKVCIEQAKKQKTVTYKTIHNIIFPDKDAYFKFDYIRGKKKEGEDPEKNAFCNLKFYHAIKDAYKNHPSDWQELQDNVELFDKIGEIITENKDDETLFAELQKLELSDKIIEELMKLSFSGFGHLSTKAIKNLMPYILEGKTYLEAGAIAYPDQFANQLSGDENELPPLSEDELHQLTNPVVKRAISQTRKVINTVIKKHGSPYQIKIECANDLARNAQERSKIKKQQDENQAYNEKVKQKLEELGVANPTGQQIIKYKLREQQCGKCAYCGAALSTDIFTDDKQSEIDHIVPFSRCGNDRFNNKVLVCPVCNQEKGDKTPFEKWGQDPERWQKIIDLANSLTGKSDAKRSRILCETAPKEDRQAHALNDTRYIVRFVSQYIRKNLRFAEDADGKQKVITPAGATTNYLRKMYGIGSKDREANNCHHAVDACIIATVSQGQIQRVSEWNKYKEQGAKRHTLLWEDENGETRQITKVDYEVMRQELAPWPDFAKEVRIRTGMAHDAGEIENLTDFRDKFRSFESYDADFLETLHPLFVSRMPKRSLNGKIHEETIRSPKPTADGRRTARKRLDKKFAQNYVKCQKEGKPENSYLENSVLPESDIVLYRQLKQLLEEKGENAFDEPVYKNNKTIDKNGHLLSPVSTVKVYEKKPNTSGVYLNNGTQFADNGKTLCLNIYRRKMSDGNYKFFAAPLYAHSLRKATIPILPTPNDIELKGILTADKTILASPENGFEKVAQVFPNDYIRIEYAGRVVEGYYVKYGIAGGQITLMPHNCPDKTGALPTCCLGKAINIKTLPISVLGDNYEFE